MWSLKTRIAAGLVLVLAYGFLAVTLALSLPGSNLTFSTADGALYAQAGESTPRRIDAFLIGEERLPASGELLLEEPDVLATYTAINGLFHTNSRLHAALASGTLRLQYDNGERVAVVAAQRALSSLPGLFWLQLLCGLAGMVICLLVWMPAQREIAIHSFALTGLSYVLFSSAAAIYSTRDLFIPGSLFSWLSGINHFGALLFSTSLATFLWSYPRKAPSPVLTLAFYAAFVIAIVIDQAQLVESPVHGFHLWVMGIFLTGLLGAFWQGWKTPARSTDRAALRWVVVSIVAGTAFFAGGMILPAILQKAQPASQGLLFTTFLLMYAGMALGVVRYRLFNLERWWFALWAWLFGGLLVMLTDLLLAMLLSLSGPITLTLSMAVVGWCYFPVRQYFWGKLFLRNRHGIDAWLARSLPAMLQVQQADLGQSGVQEALTAVFRPLSLESRPGTLVSQVALDGNGVLKVPDPLSAHTYLLQHPYQGERLFTRNDVEIATLILSLHELVSQTQTARLEGANEERNRIRQDMHDDLGAKLLHLLHSAPQDTKPLVREAIRDLRELLKSLEGQALPMDAAASQWQEETLRRCSDHGVALQWEEDLDSGLLNAEQFSEITRILREAVTNALKHARPSAIAVSLRTRDMALQLEVCNDGLDPSSEKGPVRGLDIMATRAKKIGAGLSYETRQKQWVVSLVVSLAVGQEAGRLPV